jgi:hypothetical protein
MSEMQAKQPSAVVFGARNLGRAVIELLVSDGWAVTGVARSQGTLDGVSAAGALALKADVTEPASVYGVLEQAATAQSRCSSSTRASSRSTGRNAPVSRRRRLPTPTGSPMPSSSWPTRTRAPRHTSSSSPRSPRTGRPERGAQGAGADPRIAGRPRSWRCSDPSSRYAATRSAPPRCADKSCPARSSAATASSRIA